MCGLRNMAQTLRHQSRGGPLTPVLAALVGCICVCAPTAMANIAVTIRDSDGNANYVRAKAGDVITVFIEVTSSAPVQVATGQFYIKDFGNTGWLTVADYAWNPYLMEDYSPGIGYTLHDEPFTAYPGVGYDEWGASDLDFAAPFATTTFTLLTLDLKIADSAPSKGSTRINVVDLVFGDNNFNDLTAVAGPSYIIEVPAPGAALLGGIGLTLVGYVQRRRHAHGGASAG